jgi:4,5-DOPA dioxygenase extradiol
MNRRQWIAHSGRLTLGTMGLGNVLKNLKPSILHPVVFIGHGSPMNAIENNVFSRGMISLGKQLAKPQLILVVSAHWETSGVQITAMPKPRTIYDFGGFPDALYHVQYSAPGAPEFARQACDILSSYGVHPNYTWGLDHGAWTVLRNMFPDADIPVVQLSLNTNWNAAAHLEFSRALKALRSKGVMIIGSGNMVHNFSHMAFDLKNQGDFNHPFAHEWALEANETLKLWIKNKNFHDLCNYHCYSRALQLAVPTAEHYLPLLYTMGILEPHEWVRLFNDHIIAGAFSMTSCISAEF